MLYRSNMYLNFTFYFTRWCFFHQEVLFIKITCISQNFIDSSFCLITKVYNTRLSWFQFMRIGSIIHHIVKYPMKFIQLCINFRHIFKTTVISALRTKVLLKHFEGLLTMVITDFNVYTFPCTLLARSWSHYRWVHTWHIRRRLWSRSFLTLYLLHLFSNFSNFKLITKI